MQLKLAPLNESWLLTVSVSQVAQALTNLAAIDPALLDKLRFRDAEDREIDLAAVCDLITAEAQKIKMHLAEYRKAARQMAVAAQTI